MKRTILRLMLFIVVGLPATAGLLEQVAVADSRGDYATDGKLAQPLPPSADEENLQLLERARRATFAPKRGAFYEIKTDSNIVYLFGTLHVGKAEFYPLNAAVNRAIANSTWVYLELDFTSPAIMRSMVEGGQFPNGETLDKKLPPPLMSRVESALGRYGVTKEMINNKKPWAVANELETRKAIEWGYSPVFATDLYVAGVAKILNKRVFGLESVQEQSRVFDEMSEEEQQAYLEDMLSGLEDGRAARALESVAAAWAGGDLSHLVAAFQKEQDDAPSARREMKRRMFEDRNERMAERIDAIARSGTPTFVAIGVFHLVGPNNIVELLRKRGFTVREL